MDQNLENITKFLDYHKLLKGDEKGEAQVFCDRLFQAYGHDGYLEAGATLEFRIKKGASKGTSFADLIWKPRVLIEMKKRGENLYKHYQQAFDYWINAVPNRPRYVVLCNFDDFWIYDFDKQIDEPIDQIAVQDLPKRYTAFNFLFPADLEPVFGNDKEAVSRDAAAQVSELYLSLVNRGIPRGQAQRFVLQIVFVMFSEDVGLLPRDTTHRIVEDCLKHGQASYDLFLSLFNQMDNPTHASAGRWREVDYFNGGLFQDVDPVDLTERELLLLGGEAGAGGKDWTKVNPSIFGAIFQQSMEAGARHAHGAHFTSEADILRIVIPTIVKPWQRRIESAKSLKELVMLRSELSEFSVLDPACGSGNFLYVAYRELVRVEISLLLKIKNDFSVDSFLKNVSVISLISTTNFFGIDIDSFATELAKVTLMLAKHLALEEAHEQLGIEQLGIDVGEQSIPLDNLDANLLCADALFVDWPKVDVVIGNPPFQSKNKMQKEFGAAYTGRVRAAYPDIPGHADFCVYWFRKTHDVLLAGQRAGLVGTNTIRQTNSRVGGLDYIVGNGGEIQEAISTMKWSGEAVVYVSIVNWLKGSSKDSKKLFIQEDSNDAKLGWRYTVLDSINSSLSFETDVSTAIDLLANKRPKLCYQGQTHGHKGFLIPRAAADAHLAATPADQKVLHPFIIFDDLIGTADRLPRRYVIDFGDADVLRASKHKVLFSIVQKHVLPAREKAVEEENLRNAEKVADNPKASTNKHHNQFLKKWWSLSYRRKDMLFRLDQLNRYIICGRVTARPIFEFVSSSIRPNDSVVAFPLDDYYSFGVLQSTLHWMWFTNRCSTLKGDPRYTSTTVFDTYPWPQNPKNVAEVAGAAKALLLLRDSLLSAGDSSLRELYRSVELPGANPLKDATATLDKAVMKAYGFDENLDVLEQLLSLNHTLASVELKKGVVQGPGLPASAKDPTQYVDGKCVKLP